MAIVLASDVLVTLGLSSVKAMASLLPGGGHLDHRVPLVGQIHAKYAARLQRA